MTTLLQNKQYICHIFIYTFLHFVILINFITHISNASQS
jgi:hypothetical protein